MLNSTENSNDIFRGVNSKNTCVAWFKLAELIAKKEKEKTLNLYRLIAHSFEDKAYVLQVEGDILWALQDDLAVERYNQAAFLYKKEKKFLSAAAIYEHIISLQPDNINNLKSLILVYLLLSWPEKFEFNFVNLIKNISKNLIDKNSVWDFAQNIITFSVSANNLESKYFDKDILTNKKNISEYKWVINSINTIFKSQDSYLSDLLTQYCLDNNLDLNT
ncbi:MAG: hypothetical protein SZ59_C0001G0115 [candidate division TM6 bacterium GW2011_GWF2_28_16]|nr:MAG: hypothetical protein SZ59_C0001G0115 [candidate division TM6 bacterium GW2011_GWF2_28_16]